MRWKTEMRAAGLVLAGVLVGTLLGPPLAHAAGSLVTIASGSKASQLHIAKGKAKVDTGAALVPSFVSSGKAISVEGPAIHPASAQEPASGVDLLRESCAVIPAPVHRLDRFRQATRNEGETAAGGHRAARGGEETWLEMTRSPRRRRS